MSISLSGSLVLTGSIVASGNLTTTGTITAQTLVVQTITSSIVNITGSNIFGSRLSDRQTFTGSINATGSNHAIFGNVGIGTASPISTAGYTFTTTDSPVGSGYITRVNAATALYVYSNATDSRVAEQRALPLIFETSGTQRVSINAAGSSSFTANVLASAADAATINLKQNSTTANTGIYLERSGEQKGYYIYMGGSVDSLTFQRNNGGTKGDVMALTRDGNVGIGTTSPSQKLEVVGGEIKAGRVDSSNEGGQLSFGRASDNNTAWYIDAYGNAASPQLRFVNVDNAVVAMTITGSNVGIGTSSPSSQLQIRKNYWQFWVEKTHNANVNLFSITLPDFGAAIVTIGGSRYSPGADNYSGTSTYYIFVTNTGVVSVNGGSNFGTWTPTTTVASKTVTFSSAYAGSSTNYSNASVVIQGSGHNAGSESALTVAVL
jgi:hypothetical protein